MGCQTLPGVHEWYPHPELNRDQRFRKPPLYPFELWGQPSYEKGIPTKRPVNPILAKSCRNIPWMSHTRAGLVNAYAVMRAQDLVISPEGLARMSEVWS